MFHMYLVSPQQQFLDVQSTALRQYIFHFFTLWPFSQWYYKYFAQVRYQNDPQHVLVNVVEVVFYHVTIT